MDADRFDALTKRLAAAASRRRVLGGLGGALAGALALRRGAGAAGGITCEEAVRRCQEGAQATLAAAQQACRAGRPEVEVFCLLQATAAYQTAVSACVVRNAGCAGTCKLDEEFCSRDEECCSGRCGVIAADPRPVFGCK